MLRRGPKSNASIAVAGTEDGRIYRRSFLLAARSAPPADIQKQTGRIYIILNIKNPQIQAIFRQCHSCRSRSRMCEPRESVPSRSRRGRSSGKGGQTMIAKGSMSSASVKSVRPATINLRTELLMFLLTTRWAKPCAVHQNVLQAIMDKRDVFAAVPPSGIDVLTAVLGILHHIDKLMPHCQAIIVAATRPSALEVQSVFKEFGCLGARSHIVVGGTSVRNDVQCLRSGCHVVVGTLGRLNDMIKKKHLRLDRLCQLVLRDGDELLSHSFVPQILDFLGGFPADVRPQLCVFGMQPAAVQRLPALPDTFDGRIRNLLHVSAAARTIRNVRTVPDAGSVHLQIPIADPHASESSCAKFCSDSRSKSARVRPSGHSPCDLMRRSTSEHGRLQSIMSKVQSSDNQVDSGHKAKANDESNATGPPIILKECTISCSLNVSASQRATGTLFADVVARKTISNAVQEIHRELLDGTHIVGQMQCDTGVLQIVTDGVLQKIDIDMHACQALFVTAERSSAQHIFECMSRSGGTSKLSCRLIVGGPSIREDLDVLRKVPHVIIGTPGRLQDVFKRKTVRSNLNMDSIKLLILDDGSALLKARFSDQVNAILKMLTAELQVCCFNTKKKALNKFSETLNVKDGIFYIAMESENMIDGIASEERASSLRGIARDRSRSTLPASTRKLVDTATRSRSPVRDKFRGGSDGNGNASSGSDNRRQIQSNGEVPNADQVPIRPLRAMTLEVVAWALAGHGPRGMFKQVISMKDQDVRKARGEGSDSQIQALCPEVQQNFREAAMENSITRRHSECTEGDQHVPHDLEPTFLRDRMTARVHEINPSEGMSHEIDSAPELEAAANSLQIKSGARCDEGSKDTHASVIWIHADAFKSATVPRKQRLEDLGCQAKLYKSHTNAIRALDKKKALEGSILLLDEKSAQHILPYLTTRPELVVDTIIVEDHSGTFSPALASNCKAVADLDEAIEAVCTFLSGRDCVPGVEEVPSGYDEIADRADEAASARTCAMGDNLADSCVPLDYKYGSIQHVHPMSVAFGHHSISNVFRAGGRLDDTIDDILAGCLDPQTFPPLHVLREGDKLSAVSGNRRLFVFRVLARLGMVDTVPVLVMQRERFQRLRWDDRLGRDATKLERALSTRNDGRYVRVKSKYRNLQLRSADECDRAAEPYTIAVGSPRAVSEPPTRTPPAESTLSPSGPTPQLWCSNVTDCNADAMSTAVPAVGSRIGVSIRSFNGEEYGAEYLSFSEGTCIHLLNHPPPEDGWIYGASIGTSGVDEQGWLPPTFVVATAIGHAKATFSSEAYGSEYLDLKQGDWIQLKAPHGGTESENSICGWAYGAYLGCPPSVTSDLDPPVGREGWFPHAYWTAGLQPPFCGDCSVLVLNDQALPTTGNDPSTQAQQEHILHEENIQLP